MIWKKKKKIFLVESLILADHSWKSLASTDWKILALPVSELILSTLWWKINHLSEFSPTTESFTDWLHFLYFRIHPFTCTVLQYILHVLFTRLGNVASPLP
jgi:hypothetical protein